MIPSPSRRMYLMQAGAVISSSMLAGCFGEGEPAAEGVDDVIHEHMTGARLYDGSIEDQTGETEVIILVGAGDAGVAFDPPAVRMYTDSVVRWEWTGAGGAHNVASVTQSAEEFRSGEPNAAADATFEHSFDNGIQLYECEPHRGAEMRGAIEVLAPSDSGGY